MKKVFFSFLALLLLVVSCSEDDNNEGSTRAVTQEVSFGMSQSAKSSKSDVSLVPAKVILTVKDVDADTLVYDHQSLDLYNFSGQYLTQNTTFYVGQYSVEEYHVADKDNVVIYSTPKEGSELVDYVSNPLPLSFTVAVDETTQVLPEVIAVDDEHKSEDFGYPSFGFDLIDVTKEQFGIVAFDKSNQITDFNLVIKAEGEEIFNEDLEAQTNYITISPKYDNFELVVSKNTFKDQTFNYTRDELNTLIGENNIKIHFGGDSTDDNIYEGGITIRTIEEYNNFVAGQYTKVTGYLRIGDYDSPLPELINLKGLENLTSVGSDFIIQFTESLTSLSGLENLNSIGSLSINENESLESLSGLDNLNSLELRWLDISYNKSLENLKGLENLTSIGVLNIEWNESLESISVFDNLTYVGDLQIQFNDSLESFEGLNSLSSIGGDLILSPYYKLNDIKGLTNLKSIGGNLEFSHASGLENLSGLKNLTSIGGNLKITTSNSVLKNLNGLENLSTVNGDLIIGSEYPNSHGGPGPWNPNLTNYCAISNLINSGGLFGEYKVENNAYNPTLQDIKDGNCFGDSTYEKIHEGDADLETMKDYYNFIYEGYTKVAGHLNIGSTGGPSELDDIVNLKGLEQLTSIDEGLWIGGNASLLSLKGLENLTHIGGTLAIRDNTLLTNINALENLTYVGLVLEFSGNDNLESLSGLENLTSTELLKIRSNKSLENLKGLDNLNFIKIGTIIDYNEKLTNFCAIADVINSDGFDGYFSGYGGNAYNPTIEDIKAGRCSQ